MPLTELQSSFRLLVAGIVLLLASTAADAQIGIHHYTLESLIAPAEYVVLGSIKHVEEVAPNPDGLDKFRRREPLGNRRMRVKLDIQVNEILKGKPPKELHVVTDVRREMYRPGQWVDSDDERLWFIYPLNELERENESSGKLKVDRKWRSYSFAGEREKAYFYGTQWEPILTIDLKVLKTKEEILRRSREFAAVSPWPQRTTSVNVYRFVVSPTGSVGDANSLSFPIHRWLEPAALRMIEQPESFLPEGQPEWREYRTGSLRENGVALLQYFRSEKNISLLKKLLDDPFVVRTTPLRGRYQGREVKQYPVRKIAYQTLTRKWLVDVPRPVIVEPVPAETESTKEESDRESP